MVALQEGFIDGRLDLTGGSVQVPRGPGLGVSVDENAIEQYRIGR